MEKQYAVIFKTKRKLPVSQEYVDMSAKLVEIAKALPGFIRIESVADDQGNGISVSYWRSLEAIGEWKRHPLHLEAQALGKAEWYLEYKVEICEVVR